jgi:nucleoid-associated protein YgaU
MPSTSPAANLAAFEAQLAANNQQTGLVQLQGLFGRVIQNLNQANSSERTITVGGGNLYDVAAKQYGDPTAWVLIAQANGLTDPTLAGITVLTIPPYNNSSGGVLTS